MGKRPFSTDIEAAPPPPPPQRLHHHPHSQQPSSSSSAGPPFVPHQPWTSWLVPCFVAANTIAFLFSMYVNDCPNNTSDPHSCVFPSLGRFSFEPLSENPLLGPSSITAVLVFFMINYYKYNFGAVFHEKEQTHFYHLRFNMVSEHGYPTEP